MIGIPKNGFSQIPNKITDGLTCYPELLALYTIIKSLEFQKTKEPFSIPDLAKICKRSTRTVIHNLKALEVSKAISVTRDKGKNNATRCTPEQFNVSLLNKYKAELSNSRKTKELHAKASKESVSPVNNHSVVKHGNQKQHNSFHWSESDTDYSCLNIKQTYISTTPNTSEYISNRVHTNAEGEGYDNQQEIDLKTKQAPLPEKPTPEQIKTTEAEKKAKGLKNSYQALGVLLESSGNSLSVGDWVDCEDPPEGFTARLPRRLEKLWRERLAGYVHEYGLNLSGLEMRMKKLGEYLNARVNHRFKTRNATLEELCNPKSRLFFELISESLSEWKSILPSGIQQPKVTTRTSDPSTDDLFAEISAEIAGGGRYGV